MSGDRVLIAANTDDEGGYNNSGSAYVFRFTGAAPVASYDARAPEMLEAVGLQEPALDRLVRAAYHTLGLQSYFTAGEKEVRAWTVRVGATAPQAAAVIHTDFERGFIRAEAIGFEEFVALGRMKAAREEGAIRSEGQDYVVRDGDGKELHRCAGNYQTINRICFDTPVRTKGLSIEPAHPSEQVPAALFGVRVYGDGNPAPRDRPTG